MPDGLGFLQKVSNNRSRIDSFYVLRTSIFTNPDATLQMHALWVVVFYTLQMFRNSILSIDYQASRLDSNNCSRSHHSSSFPSQNPKKKCSNYTLFTPPQNVPSRKEKLLAPPPQKHSFCYCKFGGSFSSTLNWFAICPLLISIG